MTLSIKFLARTLVLGPLVASAIAYSCVLFAQEMQKYLPPGHQASRKGPAVFLDYDQEELDLAYDQDPWAPNMQATFDRIRQKSALGLARLGSPQRYSYGTSPTEGLDLYRTDSTNAPILVHIHGGTWRFGTAAEQAFMAESFVNAGVHFIAVDFTNVIETNGDLIPLVQQTRRSIVWVYENASSFGGDPNRIYVTGHSSGGHLAGVLVTTDWQGEYGLPSDVIKGGILLSGMYDLYPVSLSARKEYVNINDDLVQTLSPRRNIDKLTAPLLIAYGTRETPEFQRQSRDFAAAVAEAGKPVSLIVAEGYDHFEVSEDTGNPYGVIGPVARALMALK